MAHKEMIHLKGLAKGKDLQNTLIAITAATELHEGQMRKSGNPYIDHPMRVTSELVALKIYDDIILASALLHDVIEDCKASSELLIYKYGLDPQIVENVKKLSKTKNMDTALYYDILKQSPSLILIKGADRCHNISTMVNGFTVEKMKLYVEETENHVLPLLHYGKNHYPKYSDEFFVMKYHIESVCEMTKAFIELHERTCSV